MKFTVDAIFQMKFLIWNIFDGEWSVLISKVYFLVWKKVIFWILRNTNCYSVQNSSVFENLWLVYKSCARSCDTINSFLLNLTTKVMQHMKPLFYFSIFCQLRNFNSLFFINRDWNLWFKSKLHKSSSFMFGSRIVVGSKSLQRNNRKIMELQWRHKYSKEWMNE